MRGTVVDDLQSDDVEVSSEGVFSGDACRSSVKLFKWGNNPFSTTLPSQFLGDATSERCSHISTEYTHQWFISCRRSCGVPTLSIDSANRRDPRYSVLSRCSNHDDGLCLEKETSATYKHLPCTSTMILSTQRLVHVRYVYYFIYFGACSIFFGCSSRQPLPSMVERRRCLPGLPFQLQGKSKQRFDRLGRHQRYHQQARPYSRPWSGHCMALTFLRLSFAGHGL